MIFRDRGKKNAILFVLLLLLPLCAGAAFAEAELNGYNADTKKYEYVQLGTYPYEKDGTERPVLWRVLSVKNGQATLMTEYIIDTSQVIFETNQKVIENRTFRRIDRYEDSDMCDWLTNTVTPRMMGEDPIQNAMLTPREGQGKVYLFNTTDMTTTDYGFTAGFYGENWQHRARCAVGTPYAAKMRNLYVDASGYSTYWIGELHSGTQGYKLWIVGYNGHISAGVYTRVNIGVRPVTTLDMAQIEITGGSGTMEDPYTLGYTGSAATAAPEPATNAAAPEGTEEALPAEQQDNDNSAASDNNEEITENDAEAVTPAPIEKEEGSVVISLLGDCSIGDSGQFVGANPSYHRSVDENGYAWPFSTVIDYLAADDLTVANLEVVFTTRTRHEDKMYYLRADRDHVNILLEGSIEAVNTVNNHCQDFMEGGYLDTLEVLDEAGIDHFGTIRNVSDLTLAKDINGIRVGFVGFSYPAIENNFNVISKKISTLKETEGCEIVIVSLHWGRETHTTPEFWQQEYAKRLIDAGADVIWGHHPHVLQPVEFYKGKIILYSTGNFTFGTISDLDPATGIFQITMKRDSDGNAVLDKLQVIACETRRSGDYRPKVLEGEAAAAVYKKLQMKKNTSGCKGLPAEFFDTGVVDLAQLGE